MPTGVDPADAQRLERAHRRIVARLEACQDLRSAGEAVVEHLVEHGLPLPSVYVERGGRLRCIAQRGYWQVLDGLPPSAGVLGRTYRLGEPTVLSGVEAAPEYLAAAPDVVDEVTVPVSSMGRVVGVVNVESTSRLPWWTLELLQASATAFGTRLDALGGPPKESPAQRLARYCAQMAACTDERDIGQITLAGACDLAGLSSALLVLDVGSAAEARQTDGPLGGGLGAIPTSGLLDVAGWATAGTSCYTQGPPDGFSFLGQELFRSAGADAVMVLALPVHGHHLGLLIVADAEPRVLATEQAEQLELLAAHAASCLLTARAMSALRERAARDPLTGLGHHASFHDALTELRGRTGGSSLLVVDVDGFKTVNDTRGHLAGDRVLRDVAATLSRELGEQGRLFRIGGDEFAALLPHGDAATAGHLADRLCAAARRDGATISVGIAVEQPDESNAAFIARADAALYRVKRSGRDGAALADASADRRDPHAPTRRSADAPR